MDAEVSTCIILVLKVVWNVHTNNNLHSLYMRYASSDEDFKFWDFLVLFRFPQMGPRVIHFYRFQCFCPVRMHRSDDCRSWTFITNVNRWAHVSFWFWKKLNFLHFLPCKEIISCMLYLKDYQRFSSSNMHEWFSF
jgi:hypothetical protein